MGVIKKGILGGFSGTVGTVVGANWRGMDVVRSRPKSGSRTPTPMQLLQRKKFAAAIKFQNALRSLQSRLYGDNAGAQSRVNLAASYLLREVVTETNGEIVLRMDKVLITKGDLTGFEQLAVTPAAGQTLTFSWTDNSSQNMANEDDLFGTAVYEEESESFHVQEGPEQRSSGMATVVLPSQWSGKAVHVYVFLQNATQNAACNSQYLGSVLVQ